MNRLSVEFRPPTLNVTSVDYRGQKLKISTGNPVVKEYIDTEAYTGVYEVTPSGDTQILQTQGKRLIEDVVIHPIPSNYGLVTWNGSVLTIS